MRQIRNTTLGFITGLLFTVSIACSNFQPSTNPSYQPPEQSQSAHTKQTRNKIYLNNLSSYREIPVDEWVSYYPEGLITLTNSNEERTLNGRILIPEKVGIDSLYESPKEYVTFKDAKTDEKFFVTIDALSSMTEEVYSMEDVNKTIEEKKPEIFTSLVSHIENNTSPVGDVAKIVDTDNPYVLDMALKDTLKDFQILDLASGNITPFTEYSSGLYTDSRTLKLEVSGTPESAATFLLMKKLGVDFEIPFVDKNLAMIVGEKIEGGKLYESPLGTKTKVALSHEIGSDVINVSGRFGDSVLTRITKHTYYSFKAGKSLEPEEVPSPLEGLKFDATVNPEETLRAVGEQMSKRNKEVGERRGEIRQENNRVIEDVKERISDAQEEAGKQHDRAVQQVEEMKKNIADTAQKAEEEFKRMQQDMQKRSEEQRRSREEEMSKGKERVEKTIGNVKDSLGNIFKKK